MTTAIIDITRANMNTERRLVETVVERYQGQLTRRIVVGFDSQKDNLGPVGAAVEFRSLGEWLGEPKVNQQIGLLIRSLTDANTHPPCLVFSFHHSVMNKQDNLTDLRDRFNVVPLRDFTRAANFISEWPEELMPEDEAMGILVRALRRGNATSVTPVLKTNLRPLLEAEDPRFRKDYHRAAALPGLITTLLATGQSHGLIMLSGAEPKVTIWPTDNAKELLSDLNDRPDLVSESSTALEARDQMVAAPGRTDKAQAGVQVLPPSEQENILYAQCVDSLRRVDFGPFSAVRVDFFKAILEVTRDFEDQTPPTPREVCREAVARTREKATTPEVKDRYGRSTWAKLEDFGIQALARAGFLRGEDGQVAPDNPFLLTRSRISLPLPDDLDFWLDAEVILQIIRNVDLDWTHRGVLAGVLYGSHGQNGRTQENQDRVELIFAFLLEKEKTEYDPERRVLRIRPAVVGSVRETS